MKKLLQLAWRVSRFRFWLYLGGTYLVGYALGISSGADFRTPQFWLYLLFFLFPANVLLYGINDYFDGDTDQFNEKKGSQEHRLEEGETRYLQYLLGFSFALCAVALFFQSPTERIIFALFLFLSFFYSAPPLRFKAWPVVDFASNILYAMPGFLAYYQASGQLPTSTAVIIAGCWTGAMHLFSAIPDIEADKRGGLNTTALWLGKTPSLWLTAALWGAFAGLVLFQGTFYPYSLLALLYPAIPLYTWLSHVNIEKIYWTFPYINNAFGMALFFAALGKAGALPTLGG